jgi:cation-transporting P-type ATPase E
VTTSTLRGLSAADVSERRAKGLGNNIKLESSRTYWQIFTQNTFSPTNLILYVIGIVLVLLGLYSDAILSVGLVLLNVFVGVIQEARAKNTLDKIALLTRPKATVIRDGREEIIDPSEVVMGDVLIVGQGDQIVVDGEIIGEGKIDVDESQLTGESDLIPKKKGEQIYSGSFVVNGRATFEAKKVGSESLANQITAGARAFRQIKTPLQIDIDFAVRLLVILAAQIGVLLGIAAIVAGSRLTDTAKMAAVVGGLIPNGLLFMTSVSYGIGAVRMAGRGALIQQFNAIESMSNVNVLCVDKTGTLTANKINLHGVHPLHGDEAAFRKVLSDFASSTAAGNRTSEAIVAAMPGTKRREVDEVPFSSARKWSAISFDDPELRGVYVMGAMEMLKPNLEPGDYEPMTREWSDHGLRVLIVGHHPDPIRLHTDSDEAILPTNMKPLGFVTFSDELRPEVDKTLREFARAGIALKIISGDNPDTVAALAKQAGLPKDIKTISGIALDGLSDQQLLQVAQETTVFGRITPQQKERIVQTLRKAGNYVAMVGDGVNDVLSLKKAQIAISMQSGSQATRGVADIVLMGDSFATLPAAFLEGQRILTGMRDVMALFLTRAAYVALIIIGASIIGLGFPFAPKQVSILTLFTVGLPTIGLAAWANPRIPPRNVLKSILHFIIPGAITIGTIGLFLYTVTFVTTLEQKYPGIRTTPPASQVLSVEQQAEYNRAFEETTKHTRTVLTNFLLLTGIMLIIFVEPPIEFFVGGDDYSGDRRPVMLAGVMLIGVIGINVIPSFQELFELVPLGLPQWGLIIGLVAAWALVIRAIWRNDLFNKILGTGNRT